MGCTMYGIPKYTSLDKETTIAIDETSANASQETRVKQAKAAAKSNAKAKAKASQGLPASSQRKVDAVNEQLNDHVTALDTLLTAAESPEVSPFVAGGTVETINITKAKASEAIASLELIMARDDAKDMVEDGLNEAYGAMADIVKQGKW